MGGLLFCCTPFSHKEFTNDDYIHMRDDASRTSAFYKAIDKLVPGKLVLDLGTGALALLALRCAEAGASHVYAIEYSPMVAASAKRAIEDAGFADQITVLEGRSQDLVIPRKVEVVVHEILGELASREGVVGALRDAAERFVDPFAREVGGWSIPKAASTWIAPATLPPASYLQSYQKRSRTILIPGSSDARFLRFPELPVFDCTLAEAQIFEDLRFGLVEQDAEACMPPLQLRTLQFTVQRTGLLAGFVFFITVDCSGGAQIISSAGCDSHWANTFLSTTEPVSVEEGDQIEVNVAADLRAATPSYQASAKLKKKGAQANIVVPETTFQ